MVLGKKEIEKNNNEQNPINLPKPAYIWSVFLALHRYSKKI